MSDVLEGPESELHAVVEKLKNIASADELAKWQSFKQRMQGAFQVLFGAAIPFDRERARTMLWQEWETKQDWLEAQAKHQDYLNERDIDGTEPER